MLSLGLTHIARRTALVAGVVAMASAVACSDEATAPRQATASIPTSGAEATILPSRSLVTVHVTMYTGTLIQEKPSVKFYAAGDSIEIKDNSLLDKNATLGIIAASLPMSATFKVCLSKGTENFTFRAGEKGTCNTVTGNATTVNAGSLIMHVFPALGLRLLNESGNLTPGGTFTVWGPAGSNYTTTIADGDANDRWPVAGAITLWVPAPGTYKWCETIAPLGYKLASPNCGTVDLVWDFGVVVNVVHKLKLSSTPF